MKTEFPALASGYSTVPPGHVATIVTCLEMFAPPPRSPVPAAAATLVLERWDSPDIEGYRALFRDVGASWMWVSRLTMADDKLAAILNDPKVEIYALVDAGRPIGLLELDFRTENECELGFFGLVSDAIGKGAGRFLMDKAIETAWSRPIGRFWVHTCHLDSAAALPFYQRSGFKPFRQMVEMLEDPRLTGVVPRTASPHVPLIEA
ncbi:GNAT family N-acetyltransferase [Neorhizobium alkalisoli]|jgi:GNAT superfamily N-acetyltransferase|uniref:Acetyltransferase (GNAT) family protein n=1 Tax=Neorhizobium alkalisoli TaxID=528178 RepID=A0A561QV43_9HYPH|nr:GNAT family N-acetyltransferase [Neorhizobium alkalisoli]TWF54189.1 acetyltransferase (GNAT) family protein [Neorhizobium alkalisoli]